MTRENFFNSIGLGLLAVCFTAAAIRVLTRTPDGGKDDGKVVIRIAHWQLETGVRAAFDTIARQYEALHPEVRIEQLAIPERIVRNWGRTQLVGGTAPDLIEIGGPIGIADETLGRYFTPLTTFLDEPNPYNKGTALEGIPWRDTFVDGLGGGSNYSESLLENYGVGAAMTTVRIYYNRDLLREITGGDKTPKTYDEFVALCEKTGQYRSPEGGVILPIAGSKYNAPFMINTLFESQTQPLGARLSKLGNVQPTTDEVALAYLRGEWNWRSPEIQAGLTLSRQIGRFMQPGYLSLARDDALFYFVQRRALMICTGSWDSTSIREQAPFPIGIFSLPNPFRGGEGPVTASRGSEAGATTGPSFGLTRNSKHPELAVDFLRFLTSQSGNDTFSRESGWLPSIIGVKLTENIEPFRPVIEGYPPGFNSEMGVNGGQLGANTSRVIANNLYRLVGNQGSVEDYTQALESEIGASVLQDVLLRNKTAFRNVLTSDTSMAAVRALARRNPNDPELQEKLDRMIEAQNQQELNLNYSRYELGKREQNR